MKHIFVIFGPSGSGQDSVIEGLQKFLPIERVITTVSRDMRPGETQGHPYYFISATEFEELIRTDALAEHLKKYTGIYYGVTKKELDRVLSGEKVGVWKVDFAGAITIKGRFPQAIVIMINAPLDIIEKRIRNRADLPEDEVQARLAHIREWLPKSIYDYQVENKEGKLDETVAEVKAIIEKNLVA
jgi:guanylate kinase